MKIKNFNTTAGIRAEIVEDKNAGFYLYIYDDSGKCIADYLQDSLQFAKEQAAEDYDLDVNSWQKIE
jgi:hypothetical protein